MRTPPDHSALQAALLSAPRKSSSGESEENFQWAVSYSDMLMVLLCFFMIYFQFDDLSTVAPKQSIASQKKAGSVVPAVKLSAKAAPLAAPNSTENESDLSADKVEQTCQLFQGAQSCQPAPQGAAVVIELRNDLYSKGMYEVNSELSDSLRAFSKKWNSLPPGVTLTVIGHSDMSHLSKNSSARFGTNVGLAALRAAKVANYLVKLGIPETKLFAQGANSESRNSRSLSLVLAFPEEKNP